MARPRQFDEDIALSSALGIFRQQGYQGTSMSDLTKAMKLSRSSFYETFGNKYDVYIKALKRFDKSNAIYNFVDVDSKITASAKVKKIFELAVASVASGHGGCMYARSSIEFSSADERVFKEVSKGIGQLEKMFNSIIETGKLRGDVATTLNSTVVANALIATFYGLQVMVKAGLPATQIEGVIAHAICELQ